MPSLAQGLADEIKRNEDLLGQYRSIGPAGAIGASMIQADLAEAADALAAGDVVRELQIYEKLKKNE